MWIARDYDNTLWIFEKYPIKKERYGKANFYGRVEKYPKL